jgi:molybdate-binding protein/transcriptional regulator with XRE-family HTH domain
MSTQNAPDNRVRFFRNQRGWSQAELAEKAGISRTAVSAIEGRRLVPSVSAALGLAKALGCTVEELFGAAGKAEPNSRWAWPPPQPAWRYWQAEIQGRSFLFPVEALAFTGGIPHDGVCTPAESPSAAAPAEQTLVLACCDPSAGLLATLYARATGFRLIVIPRSSQQSLDLLAQGLVHVAGLHFSSQRDEDRNEQAVAAKVGEGFKLLRVSTWQEGLAVAKTQRARSVRSVVRSHLRWIGREPGSGARQCMEELLPGGLPVRRIARDHRGVADAIRSGWADVGVCLRLTCEEAGLQFLALRNEFFDLCFPAQAENDPRIQALLRVVRSAEYRRLLADLPGYSVSQSGDLRPGK